MLPMIDEKNFLFVEPNEPKSDEPIVDEITKRVTALLRKAKEGNHYKGFHVCSCGACSGACDLILPNGQKTNSLAVHYIAYHRKELGRFGVANVLITLMDCDAKEEANPTKDELEGARRG